jgi:hypothetical protein
VSIELASDATDMATDEPIGPIIWLPTEAQSSNRLWLPTGSADGPQPAPASLGFQLSEGSELAIVFRRQPDLMEALFKAAPAERDFGLSETSLPELRTMVSELAFDTAMVVFARLAAEAWHIGNDKDGQMALVREMFPPDARIVPAIERFLTEHPGGGFFIEQQLFALMRLAFEESPAGAIDENDPQQLDAFARPLRRSLLAALTVVTDSISEIPGSDSDRRKWLAVLIQNGGYNAKAEPLNSFTRGQRLLELSQDENVGEPQDRCDVTTWLHDDYGLAPDEQFALGFALMGVVGGLDENHPTGERSLLGAAKFDTLLGELGLTDRKQQVLDLISAPREWYMEQFAAGSDTAMDVAWRRIPFEKRPFLRWGDGHLLLLSPRGLLSWLGEGFHHRVFAGAEARGDAMKWRYSRYYGQLVEAYALELAESVYPPLAGQRRVHGEQVYGTGGGSKTSDISIDSAPDLVLFEVAGSRLTEPSRVLAQWERVESDLDKLVLVRIRKLDGAIDAILSGDAEIPHVDRNQLRHIWPVIVTAGDIVQSELLWDYVQEQMPDALQQKQVQPLTLLDLDDFELLLGLAEGGASLVDILRRKAEPRYRPFDLRAWLTNDPTAPPGRAPSLLNGKMREVFVSVVERLGLDSSRVPDDLTD